MIDPPKVKPSKPARMMCGVGGLITALLRSWIRRPGSWVRMGVAMLASALATGVVVYAGVDDYLSERPALNLEPDEAAFLLSVALIALLLPILIGIPARSVVAHMDRGPLPMHLACPVGVIGVVSAHLVVSVLAMALVVAAAFPGAAMLVRTLSGTVGIDGRMLLLALAQWLILIASTGICVSAGEARSLPAGYAILATQKSFMISLLLIGLTTFAGLGVLFPELIGLTTFAVLGAAASSTGHRDSGIVDGGGC